MLISSSLLLVPSLGVCMRLFGVFELVYGITFVNLKYWDPLIFVFTKQVDGRHVSFKHACFGLGLSFWSYQFGLHWTIIICNGKVPSDFLVEELGIKQLLPPYLDPSLSTDDLKTGVNFASGGAGFNPLTSELAVDISTLQTTYYYY
ncbi:GDSL esterase/lipase At1g06990-like [Apium graveolens]|uniref:GDSL esterase/lipase At1g06990-like n=1 Tax=Apium graveolens TaxID=4045 RepID=UPI003D7A0D29